MTRGSEILAAMASVYRAGARKSREWIHNNDRLQDADVFEAMAAEASHQARMLEESESRWPSPARP